MAELYGVDVRTISYHLGEIFQSGELAEKSVLRKIGITAADGKVYDTNVYNLDAIIAKNYLSEKEILKLNRLSTAFLDFAETQAENHIVMNMADWQQQLEKFLSVYNFDILQNAGTVSAEDAKQKAFAEYDKFKLVQDRDYLSDFDKEIKKLSETATQN